MKTCYFDCYSGISGDMTVGALIDAGADFGAIEEGLKSLGMDGFSVKAEKVLKKDIHATQFTVIDEFASHSHEHDHGHGHTHTHDHDHGHSHTHTHDHDHGHSHTHTHDHDHGHSHTHTHDHHHHPHRHLGDIEKLITGSGLPQPVKDAANETFLALGKAEASVHGTTIDKVHFHEVGAVDSIVDIVAAQLGFHLLGIEQFVSSPLHVGAGTVKCDHGIMPVPAPATAKLLVGKPTHGGAVQGELVTPTGAALIDQRVTAFGPAPLMQVESIGYGSGTKNLPDRANVLRVMIGESADEQGTQETIQVLEANLDDMSGELLAPLLTELLDAGALDAFLTPVLGKKGRPGHLVTVLAKDDKAQALCEKLFTHSTTLGVRMRSERRSILSRKWKQVSTPWGAIRVKIGFRDEQTYTTAPEYEDCRRVAESAKVAVRQVYEAALAAAIHGVFDDE
jgi:pyridinium-3,5-bisthiocarboxylic acid mononucleotide nickel chelatase